MSPPARSCHGVPGVDKGGNVRNLGYVPKETIENLKNFVFKGPFRDQGMPDFTGKLTEADVVKIQAFIQGTADAIAAEEVDTVIASAAKQSIAQTARKNGLLRRIAPRNDESSRQVQKQKGCAIVSRSPSSLEREASLRTSGLPSPAPSGRS